MHSTVYAGMLCDIWERYFGKKPFKRREHTAISVPFHFYFHFSLSVSFRSPTHDIYTHIPVFPPTPLYQSINSSNPLNLNQPANLYMLSIIHHLSNPNTPNLTQGGMLTRQNMPAWASKQIGVDLSLSSGMGTGAEYCSDWDMLPLRGG